MYPVPPIFLSAFAMQESSCNPATIGGAGELGLMQITKDKCGGAPGGNCRYIVSWYDLRRLEIVNKHATGLQH